MLTKREHVISIYVDIADNSTILEGDIKFDIKGDLIR